MPNRQNLDLNKLIPSSLKNETLTSLVSNLFNRFVSEEQSVHIDGRIGKTVAGEAVIQAASLDRELNALIPALYFKVGAEEYTFTFDNFIDRLDVLGIDTAAMREWMSEQTFNYSLPIDYDKFTNYSNYFWIGTAIQNKSVVATTPTTLSWNPNIEPEFYVIKPPQKDDLIKFPVRLATTRNINLYSNDRPPEKFTVSFLSNNSFTVTSNIAGAIISANTNTLSSLVPLEKTEISLSTPDVNGLAPSLDDPNNVADQLCSFTITNGTAQFVAGDYFEIDVTYYTSEIYISLYSSNLANKGTITGVQTTSPLMYIDGEQVINGERILVKNQTNLAENGIYRVHSGKKWSRADGAKYETNLAVGASVFVMEGVTQAGNTYVLSAKTPVGPPIPDGSLNSNLTFSLLSTILPKPINEWQEYNFWVHRDDFTEIAELGFSIDNSTQANRPIIEYNNTLQLNSAIDAGGNPTNPNGTPLIQVKTRFNQIPQFDLFRYDGTHHGSTSGLFFYVEDPDFGTDAILKKRLKTTADYDFIFGIGITDTQDRLLYYKDGGILKSVWQSGANVPTVTSLKFIGDQTNKGTISIDTISPNADNQDWEITALTPTTFSIFGSRSGDLGIVTTGVQFICDDLAITLSVGLLPFAVGDTFTFSIQAPLSPRYVKKLTTGEIVNYPGGAAQDALDNAILEGTWLTPLRMFQNMERETRDEVAFGDLIDHTRNVIRNQDGFIGTSFGNNNVRSLQLDPGLGGTIREFSSNFPLLASMLIQENVSPLSIISFAEQQYMVALSSIDQFLINELPGYLSANSSIVISGIDPVNVDILELVKYFEDLREANQNLKEVFKDTTALVKFWPTTLPMLGLAPKVIPTINYDLELGQYVIVHHDGHSSLLITNSVQGNNDLVKTIALRSDGTSSPGIFSEATPLTPYARQLWVKPSTGVLSTFDVISDTDTPPPGAIGQYWYKKSTGQMFEWDAIGTVWTLSLVTVASRWVATDIAIIRNSLVLAIENKLYASVHMAQQQNLNLTTVENSAYSEIELAKYSAKYNFDTYAPNYNAADAFTWNYSQAVIPGISPVPAKWFDIYYQHFDNPGATISTSRPDIEPWKLLNFSSKPIGWDALYLSTNPGSANVIASVRAVAVTPVATLFGLQTIDGVALSNGDTVLLTNQALAQFNGLYVVSSAGWARTPTIMVNQVTIPISEGYEYAGSTWSLTTSGLISIDFTPLAFAQVRTWLAQMWIDIKAANPLLKLCVNINTDTLLAPYTSPVLAASSEALLTVIPPGVSDGYQFGDNGPIELAWKKSLEYRYGLARSYFRTNPLEFLDKAWGETYMQVGTNVRVERNLMRPIPASKFLMHGERLNIVNSYSAAEVQARLAIQPGGSITWLNGGRVAFEVTHCADNLTVFSVFINGNLIGLVNEGSTFDLPLTDGIDFTNVKIDDLGIPFEYGEKLIIDFSDDIIDPNYVAPIIPALELGCEGCVADGTPDPVSVVPMVQVVPVFSHVPATTKIFKGIGQWFTNLLRYSYTDTELSKASTAYRGWELKLAYRVGALLRQDSLLINTALGDLPTTAYNVILKRSTNTESKWISALRIQVVEMGSKVLGPDGLYLPVGDASDWKFRIETYNPQHPLIEYYVLDTAGDFQTFYALSKAHTPLEWKRFTGRLSLQEMTMPVTVTGLQNVLNIVFGYTDRLMDLGWKEDENTVPAVDAETGRNINWQLEIEVLVDRVYQGIFTGAGHIMNPFMSSLHLQTPIGLMSRYTDTNFVDVYSTQALYDVIGALIPINQLTVIRTDEQAITYSATPIYSGHVFIDEYEHAILMNKRFSEENTSATLFDPFLGIRIDTAYLNFVRQDQLTRKPTFNGFFLNGNDVQRNIVSSIDNIGNYYDASQTFSEERTASHALALLGFKKKDYFNNISINSATQFNFWRGLIQAKGTNMTIDAFVNYKQFKDASVDEFWAYKIAEYGDARERTFPEIKINPNDVIQKFARFQFYSSADIAYDPIPLFTQIENGDGDRWYSIDDLGKGMKFEAQFISETVVADSSTTFPNYVRLNNIYHNGDTKNPTIAGPAGAQIVGASLIKITQPGTYLVSGYTWINPTKLSPIKLFDYSSDSLVEEIGLWHPAIGIHAAMPLEVVNIISETEPAQYNYTTQQLANPSFRHLKPWGLREVGRVWWDTSNLGYIPYYDATVFPNRDSRHSRWGALAEWASVDLYEWTESNVAPGEYDALAASEEGNSEIDKSVRSSGKVALKKNYIRNRIVKVRPVAWSKSGVGSSNAHPAFGPAEFTTVHVADRNLIADTGRTASIDLVSGRNFGGWLLGKPVGEVAIGTILQYYFGTSSSVNVNSVIIPSGDISNISISTIENGIYGTRIGSIFLKKKNFGGNRFSLRMMDSDGFSEDVEMSDWFSDDLSADSVKTFEFQNFGIKLTFTRNATGIITAESLVDASVNPANDIFVREGVSFTEIIPLPDNTFINDETDPQYSITEYEWKTWAVPTQAELDADLAVPLNQWLPYVGDTVTVTATAAVVTEMKKSSNKLTLRSGVVIERYTSTWSPWTVLSNLKMNAISNGIDQITFTLNDEIDITRLSVYVNGVQQNPSGYVVTGNFVQLVNSLSEGSDVLLLYRAYQPSEEELTFNPDEIDNLLLQVQYKLDYQYSYLDIRDDTGNITGTKYYFWVQDKTIPSINKNMSLRQAKNLLKDGPSTYTVFSRLLSAPTTSDPTASHYDSCAIAGMSSLVSKHDAFKLRFLRDFTLRDDPEELNLKNIHAEWTLLRKQQTAKIPKSLWDALTNAICGEDIGGNSLPSQVRIDYDIRNNTKTCYGFKPGQIFAETALVKNTVLNTILNTALTLVIGNQVISDYITALDLSKSDTWFTDPETSRATMTLIWNTARPKQINEIFFSVLDDALANNYEFGEIFKTSYITVSSTSVVPKITQLEQVDEFY